VSERTESRVPSWQLTSSLWTGPQSGKEQKSAPPTRREATREVRSESTRELEWRPTMTACTRR
jgi:hypothetical protein